MTSFIRYCRIALYVALGLVIVLFAVGNREPVTLHFSMLAFELTLPLYLYTLGLITLGVLAGGLLNYAKMLHFRASSREKGKQISLMKNELDALHAEEMARLEVQKHAPKMLDRVE